MHASPPFQMTVRRFGIWRAALVLLAGAVALVLGVWAREARVFAPVWVWLSLGWFILCTLTLLLHAWRLEPMSLRWDTQHWYLGTQATTGHEPLAGRMTVAMDLGFWVLLHFVPDAAGGLHRKTWLPVQRHGHEAAWHAFRATVYCARPLASHTATPF